MNSPDIRLLLPDDAEAFVRLRRSALDVEPFAFATSLKDDQRKMFEEKGAVVLGAFATELIGIVGLRRDPWQKLSHKVYVWGFFVDPVARGQGVGSLLLKAAIQHAWEMPEVHQIQLWVSTTAEAAIRLYTRHGFTIWGMEPNALNHDGVFVDGYHMVLK